MSFLNKCLLLSSIVLMTGCAVPQYSGNSFPEEIQKKQIKIVLIDNPNTDSTFGKTVEDWLRKSNYQYTIQKNDTEYDPEKLTLIYNADYKWDIATYLHEARIIGVYQEERVGEVIYKKPRTNLNKFFRSKERIEYMLEMLFGKISAQEAMRANR